MSRKLESDFKTRTKQARMEGVCGRTGNYANRVYYSESYTTPEQLFRAHVILNKLDAIYICVLTATSNITVLIKSKLNKKANVSSKKGGKKAF